MTMREKMARAVSQVIAQSVERPPQEPGVIMTLAPFDLVDAVLDALMESMDDMLDAGVEAKRALYERMEKAGNNTAIMVVANHPAGTIYEAMIRAAKDGK